MQKLLFNENHFLSVGVEIELQLIDPKTGDLNPVAPVLLQKINDQFKYVHVKSELFQSMLEIDTPICKKIDEVGTSLRKSLHLVREQAHQHNASVLMAGTHPFAHYSERLLTPSSRYYDLVDRNQWITRRLQIFGLHVHLGMKNADHAIAMNNALCHYLPIILAISASSPYWNKNDTGLASSRVTFFEAIPTGGHPCLLNTWKEFEQLIERLIYSKSINSIKDLWWDIRPNLEYGTIEVRIADCPPTIKEVEAITALVHTLAFFIDQELMAGRSFAPPPEWILRENKWRASRHGVQCDLIIDETGRSEPFLKVWNDLVVALKPQISSLGYESYFHFLQLVITKGPSYIRQRNHFKNDFQNLIKHLESENENDRPDWSVGSTIQQKT